MHWRRFLLPFSILYAAGIRIRNFLYDRGILKSFSFSIPIITIGNITTGGTGKTPHIEYLIRLLKNDFYVATLSRGYGRKTKGFMLVSNPSTTTMIGDEPMQYHSKFRDILVSVGEDRVAAVENLMKMPRRPEVILLDDAFQHRRLKAGLTIVLLEYDQIFQNDYHLPAGNLREGRSALRRANTIVISKSPAILVPIERKRVLEHLDLLHHPSVFFSYIRYGDFTKVLGKSAGMLMGSGYYMEKRYTILLVTGIANPSGLIEHLRRNTDKLESLIFPDHHEFDHSDIRKIQETFDNIANTNKIILTTEKDAMRLRNPELEPMIQHWPLFYLPIEIGFHLQEESFNKIITEYVRKNQRSISVHPGTV